MERWWKDGHREVKRITNVLQKVGLQSDARNEVLRQLLNEYSQAQKNDPAQNSLLDLALKRIVDHLLDARQVSQDLLMSLRSQDTREEPGCIAESKEEEESDSESEDTKMCPQCKIGTLRPEQRQDRAMDEGMRSLWRCSSCKFVVKET